MANLLKIKRGTAAQLASAVSAQTLHQGEPYLITDEGRIAIGLSNNSFAKMAKLDEVQALDADLTAISGLTGTGYLKRTGDNTWTLDTNSYQPLDGDLTAIAELSGTSGFLKKTAADTWALETITVNNGTLTLNIGSAAASGSAVTISSGTGYSANTATNTTYSVSVGPALTALATVMSTGTTGILKKTGADTYTLDTSAYLTGNQSISITGDATGTGATAITLTLANSGVTAGTHTKVTVDAKGRVTAGTSLAASDIPTITASKISDFDTQVRTNRLDQLAQPTASVAMNAQKITGLADPTSAQDAATKNYVDLAIQGLDPKASVKAATTANLAAVYVNGTAGVGATLTNSGTLAALTIDGVTLSVNDRVLVKDQTSAAHNGIYTVTTVGSGSVAWVLTRATDNDTWAEVPSSFVFVEQGTVNFDNGYLFTADQGGTMGTTNITVTQFSGAGQITAGNGLSKTGNTINVGGTTNRISVGTDNIDIDANYVGQTSITTLGTIATGTWNATAISVTKGGLGLTAAITGLLKGDGSAYSAAVAGTDYLSPDSTVDGGTF